MGNLPSNRKFYLPDVLGKNLKVNNNPIIWLHFPILTSLEKFQKISLDKIIAGIRDCFGDRKIPLDKYGQLLFKIPISGHDTTCVSEYEIDEKTLVIISVVKNEKK